MHYLKALKRRTKIASLLCVLVSLSGCVRPPGYTNRILTPPALVYFGYAFQDIRSDYIKAIEPSVLLDRALDGLKSDLDLARPGPQAILKDAHTRAAAIHGDTNALYLNVFGDTVDAVLDDPQAPSRVTLVRKALAGMLDGLDKTTAFQPSSDGPVQRGSVGLELMINHTGDGMRIIGALPDTPASHSGVMPGDILLAIDGQPASGRPLKPIIDRLRGPVGSRVSLTVGRGVPTAPVTFDVERSVVLQRPLVELTRLKGVLYVWLGDLSPGTAKLMRRLITTARSTGPSNGLILDLRYNGGGRLDEAVSVSEAMLPPGSPIATVQGRAPGAIQRFTAAATDVAPGTPTVVLVNEMTAAGSEIIAAALRQGRHAKLLGTHTFGQGLVATEVGLGPLGSMRLSTGRISLASGQPLGPGGIAPDMYGRPLSGKALCWQPWRTIWSGHVSGLLCGRVT